MGRCKMLTKHRSKSNSQIATQDSTSDGINLISVKRGITTPNTSGNSTSYSSENMNDSQDRSPEFIMEGSQKFEYEDMSPKINARLPKFKLNLDIPENDETDNVDVDKNNETIIENQQSDKELEKTLSVEKIFQSDNEDNTESTVKSSDLTKFYSINVKQNSELVDVPRKELTSLSGYFQIPSSTFNIPSLAESNTAEFPFLNGPIPTASISEKIDENNMRETNVNMHVENFNEKLYPLNNEQTSAGQCYISIEIEEKLISPDTVKATINNDKTWSTTPEHITHVDLPVISDIDSKTSAESQITILRNVSESQGIQSLNKISTIYYESVKNIFTKIIKFCSWLAGKFIVWIKKGYKGVRNLLSIVIASPDPPPLIESELTQVVAIIKCDNERLLAVLSEKVTSVSQDLIQVRVSNEANLLALTNEINGLRETNSQLTESSNNLTNELKKLQEKVDDMKSNLKLAPAAGIANCTPVSSVPPPPPPPPPPPSISFGYAAPPPPPPPPPPPLPPSTPLGCTAPPPPPPPPPFPSLTPMMPFTKFTLNNSSTKTPASKCSTPLTSRPSITVEDLLKVTLKKAPANSMDNRRKTVPGPKGPVISLDMLREVKLKSARRRSLDQHKSPRSTSRLVRNRSQSNLSLSPTMMGAENSLSRILKPVDPNRKVFRRIQSIASNSETDLSKKETPSTKFSVGYCRKESVLI